MAKITDFRVNTALLRQGEWVDLPEEYDGLRLKVRGQGRAYFDARARAEQRAARDHGGEMSKVPDEVLERINAEVAGQHLLIDVAELFDASGQAVTAEQYREAMLDPACLPLVSAVLIASGRLELRARAEARQAAGFSAPPSAGT